MLEDVEDGTFAFTIYVGALPIFWKYGSFCESHSLRIPFQWSWFPTCAFVNIAPAPCPLHSGSVVEIVESFVMTCLPVPITARLNVKSSDGRNLLCVDVGVSKTWTTETNLSI
eukprot:GEMP01122627.1.p1 GENE.GEMP01122627.1~~GEMP01122627.1.p1  ORF type:complete len:113 (+),score=16.21 GEMP01122627.1:98-436(+)